VRRQRRAVMDATSARALLAASPARHLLYIVSIGMEWAWRGASRYLPQVARIGNHAASAAASAAARAALSRAKRRACSGSISRVISSSGISADG